MQNVFLALSLVSHNFCFSFSNTTALSNVTLTVTPSSPFEYDQVTLMCSTVGDDDIIEWRFYKGGVLLRNDTSHVHTLDSVQKPADNGVYKCEAVHNSTYSEMSEEKTVSIESKIVLFTLEFISIFDKGFREMTNSFYFYVHFKIL